MSIHDPRIQAIADQLSPETRRELLDLQRGLVDQVRLILNDVPFGVSVTVLAEVFACLLEPTTDTEWFLTHFSEAVRLYLEIQTPRKVRAVGPVVIPATYNPPSEDSMDNTKPPQQGQQQQGPQPPPPDKNSPQWKVHKKGHTLEQDSHVHPVEGSQK